MHFSLIFLTILAFGSPAPVTSKIETVEAVYFPGSTKTFLIEETDPPGSILRRLKRLTGSAGRPRNDFADPSPPDFSDPSVVRVYTTNNFVLSWYETKHQSALSRFLRGAPPRVETLEVYDVGGFIPLEAWDPTIEVFPEFQSEPVLYAGVMTSASPTIEALWPQDAWRRRVSAFRQEQGRWVRVPDSVLGDPPAEPTWLDHSYGHHVARDEDGDVWMFYERVSEEHEGFPWTTELFARRMRSPFYLEDKEYPLFPLEENGWPSLRRDFGGILAEGPRPFFVDGWYLLGFGGGDYTADDYGMYLLASRDIQGPYEPYLNNSSTDLEDFSQAIEKKHPMIWGAARPAFFEIDGEWWVLFHGILESDNSQVSDGFRDIYLAPVRITPSNGDNPPQVEILLED